MRVFDLAPERAAELREVLQRIFDGAELDELLASATRGGGDAAAESSADPEQPEQPEPQEPLEPQDGPAGDAADEPEAREPDPASGSRAGG